MGDITREDLHELADLVADWYERIRSTPAAENDGAGSTPPIRGSREPAAGMTPLDRGSHSTGPVDPPNRGIRPRPKTYPLSDIDRAWADKVAKERGWPRARTGRKPR